MNVAYRRWLEEARRRRSESILGEPFSRGLLSRALDPAAVRRAIAATLVTLVGGRPAPVTFEAGTSYASLEPARVNVDGELIVPPDNLRRDIDELIVAVASHEGGHLRFSEGPGKKAGPLRQFLYNVIEDERVEVAIARRWPALAAPLATARQELLRVDDPVGAKFLFALFYLVRTPERMPDRLWAEQKLLLEKAMHILTPFPETAEQVRCAVRRLERLVPREERKAVPVFPTFALRHGPDGRGTKAGVRTRGRRREADEWSEDRPAVVWTDAAPDAVGYTGLRASVQAEARALRAAFLTALRPRPEQAVRRGKLDRRRLHAWRFDDRLFRSHRPVPRGLTIVLILDLSGSMHAWFPTVQRIAVAFSEAAHGLSHVRLHVYGHAADGEGFPRTEITRFATPARGPVTSLGSLPHGGNNRDGHALELIAQDLARGEPGRRRTRVAIHVCDGDPSASGYRGLPAVEATRKGIATFRRTFGPLVLLGTEPGLETLGTTAVVWRDGQFANPLCRVLQAILSA